MATNTYTALSTQTLTSAVSSVTFSLSGITGYTDLVLVMGNLGMNATGSAAKLRFNGDTANNYSNTILYGTGSTAGSFRESNGSNIRIYGGAVGPVANGNNDNTIVHIQNYSNATTNKTVLVRSNIPASETIAIVGMWRSTAAITSLNIASYNGTDLFTVGSTFTIYGIAASDNSYTAKATGGTITTDVGYIYHTFTSSGTFTPTESIDVDYLVVAGGGGGGGTSAYFPGATYGGGGGAGGYRTSIGGTPLSLTTQNYTVTVGAGGTGGTSSSSTNGSASVFGAIQASGGGRGSSTYPAAGSDVGSNGGSGGGARTTAGTGNSGGYTPVEGYAGYGYANGSGTSTGGGGGASAAATSSVGANGLSSSINGTATVRAGGGGGFITGAASAGGSGGGGTAVLNGTGTAGTANTGGGGGAAGTSTSASRSGGAGGSGVVIIRYLK